MANKQTTAPPESPPESGSAQAAPPTPQPIKINVGPEMHLYDNVRYGPGVVTLKPEDFTDEEGEHDPKKMNTVKNALIASTRRTHEANQKRLGIVAGEMGPNVDIRSLRPPPIHVPLPDTTGLVETPSGEGTPSPFNQPPIRTDEDEVPPMQ